MPHLLPTATIEPDVFTGEGLVQGFLVHEAQHQHFTGVSILDNGGDKPLFIEFDFYLPNLLLNSPLEQRHDFFNRSHN